MKIWIAVMLMIAALSASALAFGGPCRQDAEKLCPGMRTRDRAACLKKHEAELSDPCKQMLGKRARSADAAQFHACIADAEKLCPGTTPGGGHVKKCLRKHHGELSDACKQEIAKSRGH